MNLPDETALRQRLHEALDLAEVGPAPVEAVFRRSRAARPRRLTLIACGAAVIAAAVAVLAVRAPGSPGGAAPGPSNTPAQGGIFASGTANGRVWRLAAVNLADPGYRCLPGVVVDGQNGDLLEPGFGPALPLGNVAFLAVYPGRPAAGFAFLHLRPGVSRVTAELGDGTRRGLRPVTVTVCGQQFRLAGFRYPLQGVTRITARSARGRHIAYTPLSDIFNPASNLQSGTWFNDQAATGNVASGDIGSGSIGTTSWRMQVTLGPGGECFDEAVAGVTICTTVGAPPKGASVTFAMPAGAVILYAGTVNARTAYLQAHLSNGATRRLAAAVVGGRKYFALAVAVRIKLTRLTLYDTHRHALADITSFPPVK